MSQKKTRMKNEQKRQGASKVAFEWIMVVRAYPTAQQGLCALLYVSLTRIKIRLTRTLRLKEGWAGLCSCADARAKTVRTTVAHRPGEAGVDGIKTREKYA